MAYDKVIDSSKLNSAMTATANAIRGKTGDTNTIAWDESTGFASAVETIQNGGDNSLLISLLQGDVNESGEFICDAPLESLAENFGELIPDVSLMDINAATLESGCLPLSLNTLILRYDGVATLTNSYTITETYLWDMDGDPNYGGTIYVPRKYLTQYPRATNWSAVDNGSITWLQIEGSEYE